VALSPDEIETDVLAFEHLVGRNTPEAFEQASGLYKGPLLEGLSLNEECFEEWLLPERERHWELALEALTRLLAHYNKADMIQEAIRTAKRLLTLDPLQEAVHRLLMRLYVRRGRRQSALRQYQVCVGVLQRELGIDPEAETKSLYQDILQRRLFQTSKIDAPPTTSDAQGPSLPPALNIPSYSTPLIGRISERTQLHEALEKTSKGMGQSIVVFGESGIGKSYLLGTIALEAYRQNSYVLIGRCYESEQVLPLAPWVSALRNAEAAIGQAREHLSPTYRQELSTLLPEVFHAGSASSVAGEDYRRLFESIAQVIRTLSSTSSVVLILEDLHWADEMTLRLLAFLSRRVQTSRILLAGTAQEEELGNDPKLRHTIEDLEREGCLLSMTLSPLSQPETAELVRASARVGINEDVLARLTEEVWAVSGGNPFLAMEIMRNFQEEIATPTLDLRNAPMPQRVRNVILRRLERLSEQSRVLVAAAAVMGHEFDFDLLHRFARLNETETAQGLEELVRRRILHCVGERFDFTHDRLRQVAFNRIFLPQRKLMQRDLAKALEPMNDGIGLSHIEALHYQDR
jgi:tetratricopeptide (TPR) repeat protein